MCPDRESNQRPFTFQDEGQPTEQSQLDSAAQTYFSRQKVKKKKKRERERERKKEKKKKCKFAFL